MTEVRVLTRENFYEVGEWAGAFECWELSAPQPELRIGTPDAFVRAHLGDTLTKGADGVTVAKDGAVALAEFLLACITEDEEGLRNARWGGDAEWWMPDWMERDRLAADFKAKRRIVERHSETVECLNVGCERKGLSGLHCITCDEPEPCPDLRDLASVYMDHPDFREEWKS